MRSPPQSPTPKPAVLPSKMKSLLLLVGTSLLLGCGQQLLGELDESSANQVVSALRLEGVQASKHPAGDKGWRVDVPGDEFARAVQLLVRHNLPPRQFDGLGVVFRKESLVSTPVEERARFIYALSQELERSLMQMDGVVQARVHPVIPPSDPLSTQRISASASVLIKYRPESEVPRRDAMVRALVAAGIEGLAYDDVRVLMVPDEGSPLLPALPPPTVIRSVPPLFWGALLLLLGLLLMAYFLGSWRDKTLMALDDLRGWTTRRGAKQKGAAGENQP